MKKKIILSLIALVLLSIPFTFAYISIASNETTFSDKMSTVALTSFFHIGFSVLMVMGVLFSCNDD